MKRKLDQKGEPDSTAKPEKTEATTSKQPAEEPSFSDLGLDTRLLQAVAAQNFKKPTLVQYKTIPLALDGQDVITKARCGSGKTMVYVLSILSTVLKRKATDSTAYTSALILVPTRELADQVFKVIEKFSAFCAKDVQAVVLKDKVSDAVSRSLLSTSPDIVISTPSTAWRNADSSALSLDKLSCLVLDEADLLLSYGYNEEIESISKCVPKGVQIIMMSATLTGDMDLLQGMFGRKQSLLDLEEPETEGEGVSQFVVKCGEDEKFLLAYVIFKIQLIKGRCIIFVNDIDRAYRLKLFLEQFYIRSCCLNAELPVNSRIHVIEEFNRGVYEILIAADEKNEMLGDDEDTQGAEEESKKKRRKSGDGKDQESQNPKKKRRASRKDQEYGMSRGIDFKNVSAVINFDFPTSASSYSHRIGRTARAGRNGMALSFYVPEELYRKHIPTTIETAERDEKVLARVIRQQSKLGKEVKPYHFQKEQVEAFRYRMNDALRAVTKVAVRAARTRELRQELLKSEKLKRYFEENPAELAHLRHDSELRTAKRQDHLRHIPEYLLPREGKEALTSNEIGNVSFKKAGKLRGNKRGRPHGRVGKPGRKGDPLKTFKARRKTT